MTDFENNPELAFAVYASTASTVAIRALKEAGILQDETINELVKNLVICRQAAGQTPRLVEHAELLTDILLSGQEGP